MGDLVPLSNTSLDTEVHNPNGISIASAIFAQLTTESCRRCRGMPFLQNCPFSWDLMDPRLTRGSLASPDLESQTASWSGQPFMHSSRQTVLILYSGLTLSP